MAKRVLFGVPIPIKSHTVVKDMSSWFYRVVSTRVPKFFTQEKSKSVFANQSMVSDYSYSAHT